jgi:hypothetical protein
MTTEQKRYIYQKMATSFAEKLEALEADLAIAENDYANEKPKQTLESLFRVMELRSEVGSYRSLRDRAQSDLTALDQHPG